jgi:hypothetical protein
VLIDLVSDATAFAALASLVRRGGTAVTTHYVADAESLGAGHRHQLRVAGVGRALRALSSAQARRASGKTVITF